MTGSPKLAKISLESRQKLTAVMLPLDGWPARLGRLTGPGNVPAGLSEEQLASSAECQAYAVALRSLQTSIDHLETWSALLGTKRAPLFAVGSLTRTAFECSLRVLWLLDASKTIDERSKRCVRLILEIARQEHLLHDVLKEPGRTALDRRPALRAAMSKGGRFSEDDLNALEKKRPGVEEMCGQITFTGPDKGEPPLYGLYRAMSAFAHGAGVNHALSGGPGERPGFQGLAPNEELLHIFTERAMHFTEVALLCCEASGRRLTEAPRSS